MVSTRFVLLLLALVTSKVSAQAKKGQNELQNENIVSTITSQYSNKYRPPSPTATPSPTVVRLSLRSFRLLHFDASSSEVALTFHTLQEYNDTRLKFSPKLGLPLVKLPSTVHLWRPKLHFPSSIPAENRHPFYPFTTPDDTFMSNMIVTRTSFVSAGGTATLRRSLVEKELVFSGIATRNGAKFRIKIVSKDPMSDVNLIWGDNKPVTFEGGVENITVTDESRQMGGNQEYIMRNLTQGHCKEEEDFGSVGVVAFSCLKVEFALENMNNFYPSGFMYASTPSYPSYYSSPMPRGH